MHQKCAFATENNVLLPRKTDYYFKSYNVSNIASRVTNNVRRVAESQARVRPVTGRPERLGLPGRPARSDKLMLLKNLLKIHG